MDGEQREILYRLDERTQHIKETVEALDERTQNQEEVIQQNKRRSKKNEMKLTAGIYVVGAAITALFTKITNIFPL